jgi:hypothetical protein
MENDNSYPRLRILLQKQIATSARRSARYLVQSCPLREDEVVRREVAKLEERPFIFKFRTLRVARVVLLQVSPSHIVVPVSRFPRRSYFARNWGYAFNTIFILVMAVTHLPPMPAFEFWTFRLLFRTTAEVLIQKHLKITYSWTHAVTRIPI